MNRRARRFLERDWRARIFRGGALTALAAVAVALASVSMPGPARAQGAASVIRVPLTVDYLTLAAAARVQIYTDNGRASLWNGSDRCQYLYAQDPSFSRDGEQVRLETNASLSLGVALGSQCVSPVSWSGIIAAETRPYMAPNVMLKLRITNVDLYDERHQKTLIVGKGFDLIKQYFIPRIETFTFDLKPATDQLAALAEAASPPQTAARVKQALASLRAQAEPTATDAGVRTIVEITVPAFAAAAESAAPAQLKPEELAAFEKELNQWDAFLVFSIKQFGGLKQAPELRSDLLGLLLDSRHRLVRALSEPGSGGPDPVRILFLGIWQRLGEIIREAARRGLLGDRSLQFLSFISAGDALFALDQAAPALGMRISADDLRRLAHIMAPAVAADPLAFSFDEDPELRRMFGVTEPLGEEGPLDTSPGEPPIAAPAAPVSPAPSAPASPTPAVKEPAQPAAPSVTAPIPSAAPSLGAPGPASPSPGARAVLPLLPGASSSKGVGPLSWLEFALDWLGPASAVGAETRPGGGSSAAALQNLAKKLKRAVVENANVQGYRATMGQLIRLSAERALAAEGLDRRYRAVYLRLAQATAWQESCWRQFVVKHRRVVFLESSSHDIGLMQVNKVVWRGFYSVSRLEWDVLYNAGAGMEILAQILEGVAPKSGAITAGHADDLARSCYAAYNGGPAAYRRWHGRESSDVRYIDQSFWSKYQAVLKGQQIDLLSCAAEWSKAPGH